MKSRQNASLGTYIGDTNLKVCTPEQSHVFCGYSVVVKSQVVVG